VTGVARKLRIQYSGAVYHVLNRGDCRQPIFRDDADPEGFLATLREMCLKSSWQVHAYCLMANHFHPVVDAPQANLVAGMKWFLGTYTSRFNRRHKLTGAHDDDPGLDCATTEHGHQDAPGTCSLLAG
jgi:REP element-mobilizing transposase RayT